MLLCSESVHEVRCSCLRRRSGIRFARRFLSDAGRGRQARKQCHRGALGTY